MFNLILMISLFLFAISIGIFMYRSIKGPSIPDRVIAMDAIGAILIAIIGTLSILIETQAFFEVILLLGILSFISTVALSKYIERGVVVDYDRDR